MNSDASGWLFLLMDIGLVAVLAAALAYGMIMWRKRRSGAAEQVRDNATRELYHRSSNE